MDDHASRAMAPLYLGVLLAISMVGPALGYILGSATTRLYIDFDRASSSSLTPGDADWIGAWWFGFLLASGVMFLLHIPFWFFPKSMEKEKEPTKTTTATTTKLEMERHSGQDDDREEEEQQDSGLGNGEKLVPRNNNNHDSNGSGADSPKKSSKVDTKAMLEAQSANFFFYVKDFAMAAARLLSNSVFLLVILAYATLFAISAGACVRVCVSV